MRRWLAQDSTITLWTLTPVEMASAIRRLVREGDLPEDRSHDVELLIDELAERSVMVVDVERVKLGARRIVRIHPLRAADALQLAAALAWADGHPNGLVLHTFDRRFALAARREGFDCPDA